MLSNRSLQPQQNKMNLLRHRLLALSISIIAFAIASCSLPKGDTPINALLITGGCCHDYDFQKLELTTGISKFAEVDWTIVHEGGDGRDYQSKLFENPYWAAEFDVVVHNQCFANTKDTEYISKIVSGHKQGVSAVVIHCAMHTYRATEENLWREFLGVTTKHHDHQSHYPVTITEPNHPIMRGFPQDWVSPMDELYIIDKLWPNATTLGTGVSEETGRAHPVFWTNQYGKARVFGTTFGHTNETIANPQFQEIVSRGLQWAAGRL